MWSKTHFAVLFNFINFIQVFLFSSHFFSDCMLRMRCIDWKPGFRPVSQRIFKNIYMQSMLVFSSVFRPKCGISRFRPFLFKTNLSDAYPIV